MPGYFKEKKALIEGRWMGHQLPPDTEGGDVMRIFARGKWMNWDEWLSARPIHPIKSAPRVEEPEPKRVAEKNLQISFFDR